MNSVKVKHNSIIINNNIYFDPYKIDAEYNNAKIVFITHSHYDHFSVDDIKKIKNENTMFVCPNEVKFELIKIGVNPNNIIIVHPNHSYEFGGFSFSTVPAYNVNSNFHPKINDWVGYVVNINNKKVAVLGDTDANEELKQIECDVLFVPVGGTYTMTSDEAANLTNQIKPTIAYPTHFGVLVGSINDANNFKEKVDKSIKVEIL